MKLTLFVLTILAAWLLYPAQTGHSPPGPPPETEPEIITVLLVGDIMLDRGVDFWMEQHGDWRWPFLEIADFLNQADLVFGNLESMISDKGHNVGSIYSFRADPRAMAGLELAGFDVLSVANNHSFDYTRAAFEDTLHRLKRSGIDYVGGGFSAEEAHFPAIRTVGQTRIGFLGYTGVGSPGWQAGQNSSGIAWMSSQHLETLAEDIERANDLVDWLIVSFHFGEEYQPEPNQQQRVLAEAAIDHGADLVVGHHPHVLQPLERYQQGWIAYSLGNFVFDQGFSKRTMEAAILRVVIENQTLSRVELIPTFLTEKYQVKLAD